MLPKILKGIIPPIVTPLLTPEKLDTDGLQKLIEHVISGGVHGIFVLGTTGEGPSLSKPLQFELIQRSTEQISGRIPVLVGISSASFGNSLELAEHAASCGADAVVLAPPYYFPSGQPELLEYLEHLAPRLPLPLFLYNMPSMTKVDISVDTLKKAAGIPNIAGFKDSSGNMIKFHEYLTAVQRDDFTLLMGPEELMAESVIFGGHGGISGGANLYPELFVALYNAAVAKDMDRVVKLQKQLFVLRRLYSCGQYCSTFIKGVKCALNIKGICSDCMAEPFNAFRMPERRRVASLLEEFENQYSL